MSLIFGQTNIRDTAGEIISVLSACYHLLNSRLQSQRQQRCVSITVVFDKQVDECENVTGTNGRFTKMSAEWKVFRIHPQTDFAYNIA